MHQPYSLGSYSHVNALRRANNGDYQRPVIFPAIVNERFDRFAKKHSNVHYISRKGSTKFLVSRSSEFKSFELSSR